MLQFIELGNLGFQVQ